MKSPGISDSYDKPTKEILSTKNDDSFMDESSFHFVRKGHRKNKSPLKKQAIYQTLIKEKMKDARLPIWSETATSLTRDHSPCHKIPLARRLTSLDHDRKANHPINLLNLSREIADPEKGIAFAKSIRVQHFLNETAYNPSPHNYHQRRYLDTAEDTLQFGRILPKSTTIQTDSQISDGYNIAQWNTTLKNNPLLFSNRFDEPRGRTFSKQKREVRRYMDHGHRFAYNQTFTQDNPGVGRYSLSQEFGATKPKFSIRKVLNRFLDNIEVKPGPLDYDNDPHRPRTTSTKGTFQHSLRLDLAKPLNDTPGPAFYTPVEDTIEKRCQPQTLHHGLL